MITQQRKDLRMNIPALRKLDAMLIVSKKDDPRTNIPLHSVLIPISTLVQEYLDNFKQKNEFWYVSRDADESEKGNVQRTDDKWWLPTVRVPPGGLSEASRKWIQHQKELVNQVLKAAMAINANVLMEMEIPEDYIESLPKVFVHSSNVFFAPTHHNHRLSLCHGWMLIISHGTERKVKPRRNPLQEHHRRGFRCRNIPCIRRPVHGAQDPGPQEPDRSIGRHLEEEDEQQGRQVDVGFGYKLGY